MQKRWLVMGAAILAITVALLLLNFFLSKEQLTEAEIEEAVLAQYPGNILKIFQEEDVYVVELQLEAGTYELQIDAVSGDTTSLTQTEKAEIEEQLIDEQQAETVIQSEMEGELESLTLVAKNETPVYKAVIRNGGEKTIVTLDAITGTILASETEAKNDEVIKTVTEAEAGQIAVRHVGEGEIDDIDLEETNNRSYYLVEIELEDDREATVQINAVSGGVMSVSWDD